MGSYNLMANMKGIERAKKQTNFFHLFKKSFTRLKAFLQASERLSFIIIWSNLSWKSNSSFAFANLILRSSSCSVPLANNLSFKILKLGGDINTAKQSSWNLFLIFKAPTTSMSKITCLPSCQISLTEEFRVP